MPKEGISIHFMTIPAYVWGRDACVNFPSMDFLTGTFFQNITLVLPFSEPGVDPNTY